MPSAPPRPVDQSVPPWLLASSAPPGTAVLPAPQGSLAPPCLVVALPLPRTSGGSAAPYLFTPKAPLGSSFPLDMPLSSLAPASSQSSGTLAPAPLFNAGTPPWPPSPLALLGLRPTDSAWTSTGIIAVSWAQTTTLAPPFITATVGRHLLGHSRTSSAIRSTLSPSTPPWLLPPSSPHWYPPPLSPLISPLMTPRPPPEHPLSLLSWTLFTARGRAFQEGGVMLVLLFTFI
ncbi:hypothetical protein DPX16_5507 [Anabarilius grahami]|uniref:Uncharacterized protein n=1 Tax=Anabarilius grahami TaxID=495550 RepID=A0A3N0Z3A0_ANAGA|nr:hypothetical protein DPX16_5507 [Anabarilius grahami]